MPDTAVVRRVSVNHTPGERKTVILGNDGVFPDVEVRGKRHAEVYTALLRYLVEQRLDFSNDIGQIMIGVRTALAPDRCAILGSDIDGC